MTNIPFSGVLRHLQSIDLFAQIVNYFRKKLDLYGCVGGLWVLLCQWNNVYLQ